MFDTMEGESDKLLLDGGTYFARELLTQVIVKQNFSSVNSFLNDVNIKRKIHALRSRNVLKKEQMALLYPHSNNVDIEGLDITLLTCILTNCCQLSQPLIDTIQDLIVSRNTLYGHSPAFAVDENTFKKHWADIKDFLEKKSTAHLNLTCQLYLRSLIRGVESEVLSPNAGEKYISGVLNWATEWMEHLKGWTLHNTISINSLRKRLNDARREMVKMKVQLQTQGNKTRKDALDFYSKNIDHTIRMKDSFFWDLEKQILMTKEEIKDICMEQERASKKDLPTYSKQKKSAWYLQQITGTPYYVDAWTTWKRKDIYQFNDFV